MISELFIPEFVFNVNELVEYEFAIYSRWGNKVFETNNPLEGWDGTVNDEPGVPDVYIYTISGVDRFGGTLKDSNSDSTNGDVTLIR